VHPFGAKLTIGGGAALVASGAALGIYGLAKVPSNCSFSSRQCAAPPGDKSFADAKSAVQMTNVGWIVGAVGVAAVAGGIFWYLSGKTTTTEHDLVATPWATPDAAGFAVSGPL
jgi:hypothetical protein